MKYLIFVLMAFFMFEGLQAQRSYRDSRAEDYRDRRDTERETLPGRPAGGRAYRDESGRIRYDKGSRSGGRAYREGGRIRYERR